MGSVGAGGGRAPAGWASGFKARRSRPLHARPWWPPGLAELAWLDCCAHRAAACDACLAPNLLDTLPPSPARPQVFWAFFLDCGLFAIWQNVMLAGADAKYRLVPVLGLASWLLAGGGSGGQGEAEASGERR